MAYKHVIRAKTKNLFNKNNATIINGYIYSGQLIITESPVDRTIVFPCKPNTTYTFSKMYTNRLFMAETSEETPAIGTTCTNPIESLGEPPSQNYCTLTTTATAKNLIITVCALYNTETDTLQEILDSVQIEEGSTPTPYTPYNYLQSNKRMIKVSDVCQLLDKSKYPDTTTLNGVTFINNGNGTFIVNGTTTNDTYFTLRGDQLVCIPNKKYLICGGPAIGSWSTFALYVSQMSDKWLADFPDFGNGNVFTGVDNATRFSEVVIFIAKNQTVNNLVFKPQLFDLTEMYGAGHEPATVAEFRQRFPNELYPYSPQCWLTSYKSAVVCKTKNLFDVNNAVVINYNSQQETADATHYVKDGIVYSDWNSYYIGTCVGIKGGFTLPAGTYTMSAKIAYNTKRNDEDKFRGGSVGFACILADGSIVRYTQYQVYLIPGERYTYTVEIPAGCKNIMLYLSASADPSTYSLPAAYCELMVEQGSTATSYVPYQHL